MFFKQGTKKEKILFGVKTFFILAVTGAAVFVAMNFEIVNFSKKYLYADVGSLPGEQDCLANGQALLRSCESFGGQKAVMILGAKVRGDGSLSDMYKDRADVAIDVYKQGEAGKILVSGDHGRIEYDEVNAAKNYLLANGIPAEDIFLDHAGFDTYDSLYRARDVFQIKTLIISTQNFHLPRAVYIARKLGIEAWGVSADRHFYGNEQFYETREALA